jgi:hypothetical protein
VTLLCRVIAITIVVVAYTFYFTNDVERGQHSWAGWSTVASTDFLDTCHPGESALGTAAQHSTRSLHRPSPTPTELVFDAFPYSLLLLYVGEQQRSAVNNYGRRGQDSTTDNGAGCR